MSFISIIETLLIGPLKLLFEFIYQMANKFVDNPGLSIIVLSLIMNILVLPLYKRADAMQEEARDVEAKLAKGVAHIKKTFSGDERMMMLQTYYRQNDYKPTNALNGSVSLLLEVPFFMAAYQFLSHLEILNGASLGPIKDLGAPDALITIGAYTINYLPVLMTVINVVSSAIYLKGFPLKTKIQLYGMAMFFLVFLYNSPSGLVFYWTLNNLFSLLKNIFYKIKNPAAVIRYITCIAGIASVIIGGKIYPNAPKKSIFLIFLGICLTMPLIIHLVKRKVNFSVLRLSISPNKKMFTLGALFLTALLGLLIPSTFIAASPQEYVDISYFHNPLWYIVSTTAMAAGFFLVWFRVFYWLANPLFKVIFDHTIWILCGVTIVNYMFFGTDLGIISSSLVYEDGLHFENTEYIINSLVLVCVVAILLLVAIKWQKLVTTVLLTATIAISAMSGLHVATTVSSINSISAEQSSTIANFNLSKKGQNVVVIMLDRALGSLFPYFIEEKPELADQFAGFTYYTNVVSHGGYTNFCIPSVFGGYEYTPIELNKRDDEALMDKHNEAIKVMPVLFDNNDFDVTVCDPIYANYKWISDPTIYDEYPDIDAFVTEGAFSPESSKVKFIVNNHRNFFCFSMMKTMPLFVQSVIYDAGKYNQAVANEDEFTFSVQSLLGNSTSIGYGAAKTFVDCYYALDNLPNITHVTNDSQNTFLMFSNNATHEPTLLKRPDYEPAKYFDNTLYDLITGEKITLNGKTLAYSNYNQKAHYHANMAAMIKIGEWLDHLRAAGVYDNTRIIIVGDHGRNTNLFDELLIGDYDVQFYHPLLMVKDFGDKDFTYSDEFMTNADVISLATEGVIEDPRNPFTGNPINTDEKYAHDQYVIVSDIWSTGTNNKNTFLPSKWARVNTNIWDKSNWSFYEKDTVLKDYAFPAQ